MYTIQYKIKHDHAYAHRISIICLTRTARCACVHARAFLILQNGGKQQQQQPDEIIRVCHRVARGAQRVIRCHNAAKSLVVISYTFWYVARICVCADRRRRSVVIVVVVVVVLIPSLLN